MRALIPLALLAVSACSKGDDAADRYQIVSQSGADYGVKCATAREAARGYLDDKNQAKYREWSSKAFIDCGLAEGSRSLM